MPQPALIGAPRVEAFGRPPHRTPALGASDCRSDRDGDRLGNFVLHREDVGEVAVIALGPDMVAGVVLDQLRGDPDAIAGLAQAASPAVLAMRPRCPAISGSMIVRQAASAARVASSSARISRLYSATSAIRIVVYRPSTRSAVARSPARSLPGRSPRTLTDRSIGNIRRVNSLDWPLIPQFGITTYACEASQYPASRLR